MFFSMSAVSLHFIGEPMENTPLKRPGYRDTTFVQSREISAKRNLHPNCARHEYSTVWA